MEHYEKTDQFKHNKNKTDANNHARINYSKQREIIYSAVINNKIHPTADFIYTYLKEEYPKLSLATVYRNLNSLASTGKIKRFSVPSGPDRYDGDTNGHYHAICQICGAVCDLDIEYISELDEKLAEKGFKVSSHNIIFNTLCDKCSSI